MKAVGIFLVVWGHCILLSETKVDYGISKVIYSFHIPLFFVISGITMGLKYIGSSSSSESLANEVKNRARRLLIPYIIWSIIYIAITIIENLESPEKIRAIFLERTYAVVTGRCVLIINRVHGKVYEKTGMIWKIGGVFGY